MASPSGTLGSKLFMTVAAIAATIDSEVEFCAQTWVELGLISSFGDFGRVFETVAFQAVADGRTHKIKGGFNDGTMQLTLGQDLSDAGQLLFATAAATPDQSNYGFRVEFNDPPSSVGGPTTHFFRGLPMSFRTTMGQANSVVMANAGIEVNSAIVTVPTARLYDRFVTGGSLAAYALFHGSDAQAVSPVIAANALSVVTGDTGTGFAADGSQLIGTSWTALNGGVTVFEARVKLSAITNVAFFVGFTDQAAALEMPIQSAGSANTITTNATDGVGFMFDTSMSTDNIWLVGVNNDVDETAQDSGVAPVADTWQTLRLESTNTGNVTFYIDGVQVGSTMTTAARTGFALYPTIAAMARSTASRTLTADHLYVRQN